MATMGRTKKKDFLTIGALQEEELYDLLQEVLVLKKRIKKGRRPRI